MVFFTLLSDDLHAAFIQDVATAKPIKKRRSILKRYFILFFGECAHVRSLSWGEAVVRGCRGAVPSGEHFPPREARVPPAPTRSPPLSTRLELHHLWKRQNKTNTTKQREVGVPPLSHLHALMRWRKGAEPGRVCSTPCSCLPASLSRPQSGGNPLLA